MTKRLTIKSLEAALQDDGEVVVWSRAPISGRHHAVNNKVRQVYGVAISPEGMIVGEVTLSRFKPHEADAAKKNVMSKKILGFVSTTDGVGYLTVKRLEQPVEYAKYVLDKGMAMSEEMAAELGRQELISVVRGSGRLR